LHDEQLAWKGVFSRWETHVRLQVAKQFIKHKTRAMWHYVTGGGGPAVAKAASTPGKAAASQFAAGAEQVLGGSTSRGNTNDDAAAASHLSVAGHSDVSRMFSLPECDEEGDHARQGSPLPRSRPEGVASPTQAESDGSFSGPSPIRSPRRSSVSRPGEMSRWFGPLISSAQVVLSPSPATSFSDTPPKSHGGLAIAGRVSTGVIARSRSDAHPSAVSAVQEPASTERQKNQGALRARSTAAKAKLLTGYDRNAKKREMLCGTGLDDSKEHCAGLPL
jgi:hypothetical protein